MLRAARRSAASRAAVGCSYTLDEREARPRTRSSSIATRRSAESELPPRSKKSSSTPTGRLPSTCSNASTIVRSRASRGATKESSRGCALSPAARSRRRSTLPFGPRGIASTSTNSEGTRYSGSRWRRKSRIARTIPSGRPDDAGTTKATSRFPCIESPSATTAARRTAGQRPSTASTSPGSTRKPRTLT